MDNSKVENKIVVVDSIMGTGKTSYAIQLMNEDKEGNYIYITPYLTEVERIKESCKSKKFKDPHNLGKGKLDSLNKLLLNQQNITSTHALFRMSTEETRDLIRANEYTLILDEVMNVVEQIPLRKDDLKLLISNELIIIDKDNIVKWNDEKQDFDSKYNDIKTMCNNNTVFMINNCLLLWTFPVETFLAFKKVYILTYLFDGQIQRYYYDLFNIKYDYKSIHKDETTGKYEIGEYVKDYDMSKIKQLVTLIENDKINNIGDKDYSLSKSWFNNNSDLVEQLQKDTYNFFKHKAKGKSKDNLWTTFKDYRTDIAGKGYSKGFISLGTRATNDYADKSNIAYCANIYINPMITQFFRNKDVRLNEDQYALSELIQLIWRSRIRKGEAINLYIPSNRMRQLFISWLK